MVLSEISLKWEFSPSLKHYYRKLGIHNLMVEKLEIHNLMVAQTLV